MSSAAIFPGQGAQREGMGRDLFDAFPEARRLFELADEILGFPLSETCFTGDREVIDRTDICQPGIFLVSAATIEVLRERTGLAPSAFSAAAGLSLGEYTALWFAGAISFDDGLRLTRLRGQLMQEASDVEPGGMTSIMGLSEKDVEAVCDSVRNEGGVVCIANLNSPGQVVISGAQAAVDRAAELLKDRGARRAIPLAVAGAFHSPLMAPASEGLRAEVERTDIRSAAIPVVANVTAEAVTDPDEIRENLVRQLVSPVRWEASMRALLAEGVDDFLEPGPGTVLSSLMRKIDRDVVVTGYPNAAALPSGEKA